MTLQEAIIQAKSKPISDITHIRIQRADGVNPLEFTLDYQFDPPRLVLKNADSSYSEMGFSLDMDDALATDWEVVK